MLITRLLTFALVLGVCVAIATPSLAIEKRKKETPASKSDTTDATKPQPQPQAKPQNDSTSDTLKTPRQRKLLPVFNDFIDVNMNGIDDRLEQGGYLVPPKQRPKAPTATTKKTERIDSTKTVTPNPSAKKPKKNGK